ncbi:MAG: PilT/PilU family type 4a pilus ATPase [Planctomycetota bacterium]
MDINQLIADLKKKGASDLHLEPGQVPAARIQGDLIPQGNKTLDPKSTVALARGIMSDQEQKQFTECHVVDFSRVINHVQCRINIMRTQRGIGLAIRLLSSFQPTIERLNLHPSLAELVKNQRGLVLICGPTGCGKSSTMAALIHEINTTARRHIVTIESPIEYPIPPRQSFIRQREVGRDTPSFERALIDALRQDPDVIMVGEMRDRETMQLTLNAAETGQLVLSTLHSSSAGEAVQRMVSAFPAEIQGSVCAQLADCLIGVVAQRLRFRDAFGIRVPVCEVMAASHSVRALIRQGQFFKLPSAIETGLADGSWSIRRYEEWLDKKEDFFIPERDQVSDSIPPVRVDRHADGLPLITKDLEKERKTQEDALIDPLSQPPPSSESDHAAEDVFIIEEPDEKDLGELLKKLDDKPRKLKKKE